MSLFQIDDVLSLFQFMASFCLLLQNFGFRKKIRSYDANRTQTGRYKPRLHTQLLFTKQKMVV